VKDPGFFFNSWFFGSDGVFFGKSFLIFQVFFFFFFYVDVSNVYCQKSTKEITHLSFSVKQELLIQGTLFRYTLTMVGMKHDSIWRYMGMQTLV